MSTFTLFSSETCDVNAVPSSTYLGNFTDLTLYANNVAYAIHQPNDNSDKDMLVQFEMTSFVSWAAIDDGAMYYRNGYHIRRDKVGMSISYLTGIDTVMIMNNPHENQYR